MSKAINTKLLCCWTVLCIFGCGSLPDMVMSARYLPTRRSIPTKLERDERLREFFEHILESERDAHLSAASKYANQLQMIQKKSSVKYALSEPMDSFDRGQATDVYADTKDDATAIDLSDKLDQQLVLDTNNPTHFHHHQSWPFGAGTSINRFKQVPAMTARDKGVRGDVATAAAAAHRTEISTGGMMSLNGPPRSHGVVIQAPHRPSQQQQQHQQHQQQTQAALSDTSDPYNELDWLAANGGDAKSMLDYDALYDDVNVNKRSLTLEKFDRYQQPIDAATFPLKSLMQSSPANKQRH